ncbi:hypothetical protein ACYSNW_08420 [Enterococcus sp. LJL99]
MVKKYVRNVIQIFSMVFTFVVLVNFLFGKGLTSSFVTSVCFVALVSAVLSILFYDISPFTKINPFLVQIIYVLCIIITVDVVLIRANGHQLGVSALIGNLLLILSIYGVVRWVAFAEDKKEADKINQALKKMREGE